MSLKVKPIKNPGQHMADVLVFENREEAHMLLDEMESFIKAFNRVSIDVLYTMTGSLGYDDPPYNIGWTNLSEARVVCMKGDPYDYYKIQWPRVKIIESTEDLKWGFKELADQYGMFEKGTTLI